MFGRPDSWPGGPDQALVGGAKPAGRTDMGTDTEFPDLGTDTMFDRRVRYGRVVKDENGRRDFGGLKLRMRIEWQGRLPFEVLGRIIRAGNWWWDGWFVCLLCEARAGEGQRDDCCSDSCRCSAVCFRGVRFGLLCVFDSPATSRANDTDHRPPQETGAGSESSVQNIRSNETETLGGGSSASDCWTTWKNLDYCFSFFSNLCSSCFNRSPFSRTLCAPSTTPSVSIFPSM